MIVWKAYSSVSCNILALSVSPIFKVKLCFFRATRGASTSIRGTWAQVATTSTAVSGFRCALCVSTVLASFLQRKPNAPQSQNTSNDMGKHKRYRIIIYFRHYNIYTHLLLRIILLLVVFCRSHHNLLQKNL